MSATLMYVGIWAVLATGVGIFAIAILFLQTARRYVDLTEKRLELLREGEAFLLKIVQRQGRALEESPEREAQQRERAPEMVGYVIGRQQGEESSVRRPPEDRDLRPRGARGRHSPSAKDGGRGGRRSLRGLRKARRAYPRRARRIEHRHPRQARMGRQAAPGVRRHREDHPEAGHARGALPRAGDRQRSHLVPHRHRPPARRSHGTLRAPTLSTTAHVRGPLNTSNKEG
jgi:hypothetical protein